MENGTTVADCSPCEPGWQGEFCELPCHLGDERVDIALVMDVSGSLNEAPDKQISVYEFLHNFVRLFDTVSRVRVSLVTFSHFHQVDISPVQHITSADFTSTVFNISKYSSKIVFAHCLVIKQLDLNFRLDRRNNCCGKRYCSCPCDNGHERWCK